MTSILNSLEMFSFPISLMLWFLLQLYNMYNRPEPKVLDSVVRTFKPNPTYTGNYVFVVPPALLQDL